MLTQNVFVKFLCLKHTEGPILLAEADSRIF